MCVPQRVRVQNCLSISKTLILCYFTQFTCHWHLNLAGSDWNRPKSVWIEARDLLKKQRTERMGMLAWIDSSNLFGIYGTLDIGYFYRMLSIWNLLVAPWLGESGDAAFGLLISFLNILLFKILFSVTQLTDCFVAIRRNTKSRQAHRAWRIAKVSIYKAISLRARFLNNFQWGTGRKRNKKQAKFYLSLPWVNRFRKRHLFI